MHFCHAMIASIILTYSYVLFSNCIPTNEQANLHEIPFKMEKCMNDFSSPGVKN